MDAARQRLKRRSFLLLALVCATTAVGCGEETPFLAVYELAHDLEHHSTEEACDRLMLEALLPDGIAGPLGIAPGEHADPRSWDRERSRCVQGLGRSGVYSSVELDQPLVRSVQRVGVPPEDGITAAAMARVRLDGGPTTTVRLVEFRGIWRVVLLSDGETSEP